MIAIRQDWNGYAEYFGCKVPEWPHRVQLENDKAVQAEILTKVVEPAVSLKNWNST